MQLQCDLKYMVYNRPKNENVEMIYNDLSHFSVLVITILKIFVLIASFLFLGQIGRAAS